MLGVLVVVLLVAVTAGLVWPATYVSTGTILIEQQEVPVDLVRSTISSFADQRIQMISQRVMTSENLLAIVQKYDLYAKERKRRGREYILGLIREDIKFGSIKASVIDPRPVLGEISFAAEDCAAAVENMLLAITALGYGTPGTNIGDSELPSTMPLVNTGGAVKQVRSPFSTSSASRTTCWPASTSWPTARPASAGVPSNRWPSISISTSAR